MRKTFAIMGFAMIAAVTTVAACASIDDWFNNKGGKYEIEISAMVPCALASSGLSVLADAHQLAPTLVTDAIIRTTDLGAQPVAAFCLTPDVMGPVPSDLQAAINAIGAEVQRASNVQTARAAAAAPGLDAIALGERLHEIAERFEKAGVEPAMSTKPKAVLDVYDFVTNYIAAARPLTKESVDTARGIMQNGKSGAGGLSQTMLVWNAMIAALPPLASPEGGVVTGR